MTRRSGWRLIGLALTGLLVVALAVVPAAWSLTTPATPASTEAPAQVTVSAGRTNWACAPAPLLPTAAAGDDVDYDDQLGTGGGAVATAVELRAVGADGAPTLVGGAIGAEVTEGAAAGSMSTLARAEVAEPLLAQVDPEADGIPLVAGAAVARADDGDLRGLSATACTQPSTGSVLVGGSTEPGASARLILTNPGETPAAVTVTGWGATGPLPPLGEVLVPPGSVQSVLLEGAWLESRLAVQLDVDGGRVVGAIQDSSLNGLVPAGTEIVGATADPATRVTTGTVTLTESTSAFVRVLNPSTTAATITVSMLGADGTEALGGAVDQIIEPGTVVDIALDGVPVGDYAISLDSDEPVTGAVRVAHVGEPGEQDPDTPPVDIAWMPAIAPQQRVSVPVLTELVDTTAVAVANPTAEPVTVTVGGYDESGQELDPAQVEVPPGATRGVQVPQEAVVIVLEGTDVVASAQLFGNTASGTLVAAMPAVPDPYTERQIEVIGAG